MSECGWRVERMSKQWQEGQNDEKEKKDFFQWGRKCRWIVRIL